MTAEVVLREVARATAAAAEHDSDGAAIVLDRELRFVGAGGPVLRRHGIDTRTVAGRPLAEVATPWNLEALRDGYEAALDGRTRSVEITSADERSTFSVEFQPVRGEGSEVVGALALIRERTTEPGRRRLSKREREVLSLAAMGLTSAEIAEVLVLSPTTIESHARSAVERLGARNRPHAIAIALAGGEIDVMGPPARSSQGVFELSPFPMSQLSLDARVLAVNGAFTEALGWPAGEAAGQPIVDLVHPEDAEAVVARLGALASGRTRAVVDLMIRARDRDGRWHPMAWSGAMSADGASVYAIGRPVGVPAPNDS